MEECSNSSSGNSFLIQVCDVCNSKAAVLYCRADCAKLCLFCDQQVHSANALSLNHFRSLNCDYCGSEPASIQCSIDKDGTNSDLVLCQGCDSDSSASLSVHNRTHFNGFTGCPNAFEFGEIFWFDLQKTKLFANSDTGSCLYDQEMVNNQDSVVPSMNSSVFLRSGKCRQEVYKQLLELGKRERVRRNEDGEELGPETPPPSRCGQQGDLVSLNADDEEFLHRYTSMLMLPNLEPVRQSDGSADGDLLWDCNPTYQAAQVWDFELGRTSDRAEPGQEEAEYDETDPGFAFKNCCRSKETAFNILKVSDDVHSKSGSTPSEDIPSRNNCSNQQLSKNTEETEERTNISPIEPSSSESVMVEAQTSSSSPRHVEVMEKPHLAWIGTDDRETSKVDVETFAQNRGNAMLRYMEKKKNRRYGKSIRYESRKARADTRERVKGRFVKVDLLNDGS